MTNDSTQLAVYCKDQKELRIFKIDTNKNPEEAFRETFENIENETDYVYHQSQSKEPMDQIQFEGKLNWILMRNNKEIEVLNY